MGMGTSDRSVRDRQGKALRHSVRRRCRGPYRNGRRGIRGMEEIPAGRQDTDGQQARQFLGDGRHRTMRTMQRNPCGPQNGRGEGCPAGARTCQQGTSPRDRDLEPRVHAVQPQGRRTPRTAPEQECGHRNGFRKTVHDAPGQDQQLRH